MTEAFAGCQIEIKAHKLERIVSVKHQIRDRWHQLHEGEKSVCATAEQQKVTNTTCAGK